VVLVDSSGAVAYANPAAKTQLGGPSFVPPVIASPGLHDYVVHHPQRRELRAMTVRLEDGRTLIALQDVTESKRIEAMRRDFVADASHELKTPVAAVLAVAETLEHAIDEDPSSARRFVPALVADARRLGDLVADLLDLARFESAPPSPERASLSGVVRAEIETFGPAAQRKGLRIESMIDEEVFVAAASEDLALVARNLLDNAVRYTDAGGVSVRVFGDDGHGIVEVSDTGVGIPAKDLPRIFERFYRVDKARSRDTGGTGLGLSIVRHVVEGLGGSVKAESEFGKGSRFVVTMPRA
jgi:two-component system phosphate regulon sensor histidine kinase PhoR